jgi:hypothetical protein
MEIKTHISERPATSTGSEPELICLSATAACRMVHLLILLALVVVLPVQSQAQDQKWPTLTWRPDHPQCDAAILDGHEVKGIRFKGTDIIVVLDDTGDYLAFLVSVVNRNDYRLIVNPASASARIQAPKPSLLLSIPADKVAKSMEHQGRWKSMLGVFFAGMATRQTTGTITDQFGNQSSVTLSEPDTSAQRNAQRAAAERANRNRSAAEIIREIGLRANTVFPNTSLSGWIFFEKKKFTSLTVSIFTGEAVFELPFTK